MVVKSILDTSAEARFARQAVQLKELLMKILQPPDDHPFPELALSIREITLLFTLHAKSEMIMTDLASAIQAPLSTVTRMVDRLEVKGLIERSRSKDDRRLVVVRESEEAKIMGESFEENQLDAARRILQPLSFGEREILIELLTKLNY